MLIVLASIGVALAGYLTYIHYSGTEPPCSIKGNPCSQVQKSQYSELAGVPVALIGLLGYIVILGSLLVRETETTRFATAGLTLGGLRLQPLPHLPRGLHARKNLRVVRRQRDPDDDHDAALAVALPAARQHRRAVRRAPGRARRRR